MRWALLFVAVACAACTDAPAPPLEWSPPVSAEAGCTEAATIEASTPLPIAVLNTSFGEVRAVLETEAVPVTAGNFIDLARSGFYDGTRFHYAVQGFAMQGGDPLSRDDNPDNDGAGGPGYTIPDEFHHRLRHDRGVLTMANQGPGTAGSQFLVTFAAQPHLDDRHAVFGRVVEGWDVLDRIEAEAADPVVGGEPLHGGVPQEEIVLRSVRIESPPAPAADAVSMGLWAPDGSQQVPTAGGAASFLVVAESCHPRLAAVTVASAGIVEPGFDAFVMPALQRVAFIVTVQVDAGPPADITVPVELGHRDGAVRLDLHVAREDARPGATDRLHYIAMLADGRVVDASMPLEPQAVFRACCEGVGAHMVGPDSLPALQGLQLTSGTSDAVRAADAYGTGAHPLAHRTVLFLGEGANPF